MLTFIWGDKETCPAHLTPSRKKNVAERSRHCIRHKFKTLSCHAKKEGVADLRTRYLFNLKVIKNYVNVRVRK